MQLPKEKQEILDIMKSYRIASSVSIKLELKNKGYELNDHTIIHMIKNIEKHSPFKDYGYLRIIRGTPFMVILAESREELSQMIPEVKKMCKYFINPLK